MPFWQVRQKLGSSVNPNPKKNAYPHQNLFHYCEILEFMHVNEFLIQNLERFAWHSHKFPCFVQALVELGRQSENINKLAGLVFYTLRTDVQRVGCKLHATEKLPLVI